MRGLQGNREGMGELDMTDQETPRQSAERLAIENYPVPDNETQRRALYHGVNLATMRMNARQGFVSGFLAGAVHSDVDVPLSSIHVVFDGPESGRFVEVENADGKSINAGEWVERLDRNWALVIPRAPEKMVTPEKRQEVIDWLNTQNGNLFDAKYLADDVLMILGLEVD